MKLQLSSQHSFSTLLESKRPSQVKMSATRILDEKTNLERELLASINQNISEGLFRAYINQFIYVNTAFAHMFGYSDSTELERIDATLLYKNQSDRKRLLRLLYAKGSFQNEEVQFIRKDGTEFTGLMSCTMFENNENQLLWDGAIRDITVERAFISRVEKSEQLLQSINKNITDGIYRSEMNDGLIYVNSGFINMFGYQREEDALNSNIEDFYFNPADRQKMVNKVLRHGYCTNFEVELKRKDGSVFWGSMSSTVHYEGSSIIFDGAIRDITSQKMIEESLKSQNDRLKEFSYIISHNIRSSVANMMGLLEMRKEQPNETQIMHMLQDTTHQLDATLKKVNHLLNFEKELEHVVQEVCDLRMAIEHALEVQHLIIQSKKIQIELKLEENVKVQCPPAYLDSILYNLISNAIKYGTTKTERRIVITASGKKSHIMLSIKDFGFGIDMEKHGNKLFTLGSRFHSMKADGQGLGLFMTKRQVDAIGGKITVTSAENQGSTFVVQFPAG